MIQIALIAIEPDKGNYSDKIVSGYPNSFLWNRVDRGVLPLKYAKLTNITSDPTAIQADANRQGYGLRPRIRQSYRDLRFPQRYSPSYVVVKPKMHGAGIEGRRKEGRVGFFWTGHKQA